MANLSGVNKYFAVAKEGFVTTTSSPVASGATTVQLTSVAGYSNGDTVVLVIDADDVNKKQAFTGVVDTGGSQITNVVWTEGANTSHILGAPVIDYVTASHQSMGTKGLLVSHNQDGTLKAGAVANAGVLATDVVETAKIKDGAVTPEKWTNPYKFYAYRGTSNQIISSGTFTTVALNAESFDTNNNFNTSTYKYTPPVNGFYMLTGQVFADFVDGVFMIIQILKNSTIIAEQRVTYPSGLNLNRAANASVLAQLTTSDEITLVAYIDDVSTPTIHTDWTFLCGYLVSLT